MQTLDLTPDEHGRLVAVLQVAADYPKLFGPQSRALLTKAWTQLYGQLIDDSPYTPVVMQDELVEALTRGMQVLDKRWHKAQDPGIKSGYAAAKAALAVLRDELTPERGGAATPPAATTGAATPAADESATGVAPPAAAPSPSLDPCEEGHRLHTTDRRSWVCLDCDLLVHTRQMSIGPTR